MRYETVLLIGGPKDGARLSVLEGIPFIRCAVPPTGQARIASHNVPECTARVDVTYRREPMHSSMGFKGAVYVIDNGVDVLPALIDGYRGSREAFEALARERGYSTEQDEDGYISGMTTELYEFWRGGSK